MKENINDIIAEIAFSDFQRWTESAIQGGCRYSQTEEIELAKDCVKDAIELVHRIKAAN